MKSRFILNCMLGSAVFITQLASGIAVAASERQSSLISSSEIQEYASDVAENIRKRAEAILSVPFDQQTFENTLKPWNRLSAQLFQDFNTLDALAKPSLPSIAAASQALDELYAYLLKITQDPQLYQALMGCSHKIAHDDAELDPFQRYIANRFINNGSNEPVYLHGSSEEKSNSARDLTILNLKSGFLPEGQASDLARTILSENADVVCIQDVYDLYEVLQDDYAHFIYAPSSAILDLQEPHHDGGLLIASKYQLEQAQFNLLQADANNLNEGFFDFAIKNESTWLGHVYATHLKRDPLEEAVTLKFLQIMEKMQDDFSEIEEESMPFFLCGDLNTLQGSQESKTLMNTYFYPESSSSDTTCTLLLQSLPAFPNKGIGLNQAVSTTSMVLIGNHSGLLTVIKRESPLSASHAINPLLTHQQLLDVQKTDAFVKDRLKVVPAKSHNDDKKAGGGWEVGIDMSYGGRDGPQFDAYAKAEAHDDKGNYAEGRVDHNFNKNEGTVGLRGGNKNEEDK
jgi:endonuclease/exonuclease/phosphatase family metal-dependent hydrolase